MCNHVDHRLEEIRADLKNTLGDFLLEDEDI